MTETGDAAKRRVLWFGSYSRGPGYPRAETLMAGLREAGHTVHEVHAPLFGGADERVGAASGGGAVALAWRQAGAAFRLARGWFAAPERDLVVVGSGGVVDVALLRLLQNVQRLPCLYDAFIPQYDTVVRDRRLAAPESLRARLLWRAERTSCRLADRVLVDTSAHGDLLASDYSLPRDDFRVVPVAQRGPETTTPLPRGNPLRVVLVATFIPLHGVETVLDAARLLSGEDVELLVIGRGQEYDRLADRAADLPHVRLSGRFQPEAEVRTALREAHVGLGIFGTTEKAGRVVPLKAALTLSEGRVLVTRDSAAARDALGTDGGAAVLVPPGNAEALAAALVRLRDDRARLSALAAAGRRLYERRFTPRAAAQALLAAWPSQA